MTIIACARGVLAADSRAVHPTGQMGDDSSFSSVSLTKLKVLAGELLAVAVCGPVPTKADWQQMEQVLLHYCLYLERLHPELGYVHFEKEHSELEVFKQRFLMVMTRECTYLLMRHGSSTDGAAIGLQQVDPEANIAYGTGANIAYVAFAGGANAREAADFVLEQDHLTGGPVLSVTREQLHPFASMRQMAKVVAAERKRKGK